MDVSDIRKGNPMDNPTPVIRKIIIPAFKRIIIETNDNIRLEADLTPMSAVYCFPQNESDWNKCSIDSYGLAVVWSSRFEIHVDQILGLATKREKIPNAG
jgi:hypothetical protein